MNQNLSQPEMPPPLLYKYVTPERVDVIERGLIRYTQASVLNDLFELNPHLMGFASVESRARAVATEFPKTLLEEWNNLPEAMKQMLPWDKMQALLAPIENQTIQALGQWDPLLTLQAKEGLAKASEQMPVLSLTVSRSNLLMWAHYADNHKGIVIGVDAHHPHFNERRGDKDELRHLRAVQYRTDRPTLNLEDLSGPDLMLAKADDWKYEQEWRIVRSQSSAREVRHDKTTPVYLFELPHEVIKEVVLGVRSGADTIDRVRQALDRETLKHVQVFHALPDAKSYQLEIRHGFPGR